MYVVINNIFKFFYDSQNTFHWLIEPSPSTAKNDLIRPPFEYLIRPLMLVVKR